MKVYRKFLIIILTVCILFYLAVGLFFKVYYSNLGYGNFLSSLTSNVFTERVIRVLDNRLKILENLQSIYYFNPNLINKNKTDLIFDLSKKDLRYNDSIIYFTTNNYNVFEDKLKEYKKTNIIYNNERLNVRYKFFGSSLTPYLRGYVSLKLKSKSSIDGLYNFNLINGFDANYKRVFLNYFGKKNNLISEDPGKIVSVSFENQDRDYYMYQTFGQKYFNENYSFNYLHSYRKITSNSHWKLGSHKSQFDNLYYNLDKKLNTQDMELFKFNEYKRLLNNNYKASKYEKDYYGRFMSLIYFFGHPHQIEGDNEKWIVTSKYLLPLYRNEGHLDKYFGTYDTFDSNIFEVYAGSKTLDKYKFFLTDNFTRNSRNKSFYKLITNKEKILKSLDSIYNKYEPIHRRLNRRFLEIKYSHSRHKNNLIYNFKNLENYLDLSIAHVIKEGDTIKLQSDSFVKLKISINDQVYFFYPKKFYIKDNKLENVLNEFKLYYPNKVNNFKIINDVTGKELDSLNINFQNVF